MLKGLVFGAAIAAVIGLLLYGGFFKSSEGLTSKTVDFVKEKLGSSDSESEIDSEETGESSEASSSSDGEGLGSVTGSAIKLTPKQTQFAFHTLILHILNLREVAGKDIIKQAELVTVIDKDIHRINSENIQERWEATALCLSKTCADADFMQLIRTVAIEGDRQSYTVGSLITNILTANKYWNTDNTIRFSEAVDSANKQIQLLSQQKVSETWKQLVTCNGKCREQNALTFQLVREIVESQQ